MWPLFLLTNRGKAMQRRTITKLLRKNYSVTKKRDLVVRWANSWEKEQAELIDRLGVAIKDDDYDELCICTGQLKEMSSKKFTALINCLCILLDEKIMANSIRWSQADQDASDAKSNETKSLTNSQRTISDRKI